LVTVWTAESRDKDGVPVRDKGSVSYPAAIESAAEADTATCCAARGQAAYEAASGAYRYERRRAEGYQLFEHDDGGGSAYAEAAGDGEAMQSNRLRWYIMMTASGARSDSLGWLFFPYGCLGIYRDQSFKR
jgi:hypothetical protein